MFSRTGSGSNLLREVVPAFRSLEDSANNVQFPIEWSHSTAPPSCALEGRHEPAPQSCAKREWSPSRWLDRLHPLPFRLNTARRKVWDAIRKKLSAASAKGRREKSSLRSRELARLGFGNQLPLFALRFPPVACVQRLPEPLTVHEEMRVPSVTAFFECHASSFLCLLHFSVPV